MSGLGATPVLIGLNQLMANLNSNSTECAITGSMSGNTLGLHEITSHIYTMPITWGLALFGVNQNAWNALPGDLRALLSRELPKLEAAIWAESERETLEGFACNRGLSTCTTGRKGRMTEISTKASDEVRRKQLLENKVLPNWLQRCTNRCAELWNQTIAVSSGLRVNTPQ